MRVVFLVPRRADKGHRDKLWTYCRRRWEGLFPDIPIFEGHHDDGPFNRSAAINRAARAAGDWDLAIVIDSDVILKHTQVQAAIDRASETGKVTWAHRRWRGITEDWSRRIVADKRDLGPELERVDDMDVWVERTTPLSWSCCFVVPRAVFDDAGGFDERFVGWGFEDLAWQSLVVGLYGFERIDGDVIHLWHPRSEERIILGESAATASQPYVVNGRLGRRYMYALRRDYGRTDRVEPSSAEEIQRDLRNLERDDEKFARLQPLAEREKWEGWWPTLEELRDGAKAARRAVTLVVHSGGHPDNWPVRREYLQRSLASLTEQVRGNVVQRVVYSDWGAEINAELAELVEPFGFYVAGPDEHVGYTANMQRMWRYLGTRARGSYVFQSEDDFLFTRPVVLEEMIEALDTYPSVAQIVLLRGAYYPRELESDGILGWPRDQFQASGRNGSSMLLHRLFWSQNPALYRREITATPWPKGESSERLFGDVLLRNPETRFALWGSGEPHIEHIGEVRAGTAY